MTVLPFLDPRGGPPQWGCRIGKVRLRAANTQANAPWFGGITYLDIDPQRILANALEDGMRSVVVIGYDGKGEEYFAASAADGGYVLWLLERCKRALLSHGGPSERWLPPPAA